MKQTKISEIELDDEVSTYYHIDYSFTTSLHLDLDEHKSVNEIYGKIYKSDEYHNKIKNTLIGSLELHLYKPFMEDSILEAMDRSHDTCWLLNFFDNDGCLKESIINKFGDSLNFNILVLENLIIKNKYRNNGIGSLVLDSIKEHFRPMCGYFILSSYPLQFCEINKDRFKNKEYCLNNLEKKKLKASKSLNKFYEKNGFQKLGRSGGATYYIGCLDKTF
jgi:hypothetical protein